MLFGGTNGTANFTDVWSLDFSRKQWTQVRLICPFSRSPLGPSLSSLFLPQTFFFPGKSLTALLTFHPLLHQRPTFGGASPLPRSGLRATTSGHLVFVYGGRPLSTHQDHAASPAGVDCSVYQLNTLTWHWTILTKNTSLCPEARFWHTFEYDAMRQRLILFGGRRNSPSSVAGLYALDDSSILGHVADSNAALDDLWTFNLTTGSWARITTQDGPAGRFDQGAALINSSLYIFYGRLGTLNYPNEPAWHLNLDSFVWTRHIYPPGSNKPTPRGGLTSVVLQPAALQRQNSAYTLIFGGETDVTTGLGVAFQDAWTFSPTNSSEASWTSLSPTALPALRLNPAATVLSSTGTIAMHGGFNEVDGFLDDLWLMAADTDSKNVTETVWTRSCPALNGGQPSPQPQGRAGHTMIALELPQNGAAEPSTEGLLVIHGGHTTASDYIPYNDTWLWNSTQQLWTQTPAANSSSSNLTGFDLARAYHLAASFDSFMLIHGGQGRSANGSQVVLRGDALLADFSPEENAWRWRPLPVAPSTSIPKPRSHHAGAMLNLAQGRALVVHGGIVAPENVDDYSKQLVLDDATWLLLLDSEPGGINNRWYRLTSPFAPSARWNHGCAAVADTKLVISGGFTLSKVEDDVWLLDLSEVLLDTSANGSPLAEVQWMRLTELVRFCWGPQRLCSLFYSLVSCLFHF